MNIPNVAIRMGFKDQSAMINHRSRIGGQLERQYQDDKQMVPTGAQDTIKGYGTLNILNPDLGSQFSSPKFISLGDAVQLYEGLFGYFDFYNYTSLT